MTKESKGARLIAGIFRPLYFELIRHLYRLFTCEHYRAFSCLESRLSKLPRFTPCKAKICGMHLLLPDAASFLSTYKDIFLDRIYDFSFDGDEPRILDLGGNSGLSALFFKKLYPKAHITVFEADPAIFSYLHNNIHGNGFTDVELVNKAAWNSDTELIFYSEGADGGRIASVEDCNLIKVDAVNLAEYLQGKKFDFLKMDIEGAEEFVLPACRECLPNIGRIFVEYHSKVGKQQSLDQLLSILIGAGFRLQIHSAFSSPSPFKAVRTCAGYDLQLNIFGWRE